MTNDNYRPKNANYAAQQYQPQQSAEYKKAWKSEEQDQPFVALNHPLIPVVEYKYR